MVSIIHRWNVWIFENTFLFACDVCVRVFFTHSLLQIQFKYKFVYWLLKTHHSLLIWRVALLFFSIECLLMHCNSLSFLVYSFTPMLNAFDVTYKICLQMAMALWSCSNHMAQYQIHIITLQIISFRSICSFFVGSHDVFLSFFLFFPFFSVSLSTSRHQRNMVYCVFFLLLVIWISMSLAMIVDAIPFVLGPEGPQGKRQIPCNHIKH